MAVVHEREIADERGNAVKHESEYLARYIETQKDISDKLLSTTIKGFERIFDKYKSTVTGNARRTDDNIKEFDRIKDLLKSIQPLITSIYTDYLQIATDANPDTWKENRELFNAINSSTSLLNRIIDTFEANLFHLQRASKTNNRIYRRNREASELLKKLRIRDIKKEYAQIAKRVDAYINFKHREESIAEKVTRIKQQGIKKTVVNATKSKMKNVGGKVSHKLGILPNSSKLTKLKRVAGAGVGVAGILAAGFFKSEGLAVASGAFMLARQKKIEKERERYKKSINDIHKFRTKLQDNINKYKHEDRWKNIDRKLTFLGAGGKLKAKKDGSFIAGEVPNETENVAINSKKNGLMKGLVNSPTKFNVDKGDTVNIKAPSNGIGKSKIDTSVFGSTSDDTVSQFGGGTEPDNKEDNKADPALLSIEERQLTVLEKIQQANDLYYQDHISRLDDEENKSKGFKETKQPEKTPAQNVEAKVKDKGLLGAMGDILKTGVTTALSAMAMNKMFGGAQNMTAGNIARGGARTALTAGAGLGVGYGTYKVANAVLGVNDEAEAKNREENGGELSTGYKAKKYGSMALGAVSGVGAAIGMNKFMPSFLKNKDMGNVPPDVQKVFLTNPESIAGNGIGDAIPSGKGGVWNTIKNVASKSKNLGMGALTSLGGLNAAGVPSLGIAGGSGGALAGAGLLGAGAAAGYGLHGTYKAITTGKSQQNDVARKIGFVKSKEDIESGKDSRSNFNPMKLLGMGLDKTMEGAANASVAIENFSFKKMGDLFKTQNKTEEEKRKAAEELAKTQNDQQLGFWDKMSGSDNPFLKGIGNIGAGIKNIASSAGSMLANPMQTFGELKGRFTKKEGKANEALMLKELANAGITDPKQQAMMMGQLAHESGGFTQMRELGGGARYEGRSDLGNTQAGDGDKFKGRGFIQLTGRSNYTAAGKALGLDLVNNPELAAEPANAAKIATWFTLNKKGAKSALERGDVEGLSTAINGRNKITGRANGIEDRYARTKGYMDGGLAAVGTSQVAQNKNAPAPQKLAQVPIVARKENADTLAMTPEQRVSQGLPPLPPTQVAQNTNKPKTKKKIGAVPKAPEAQNIQTASAIKDQPVPQQINTYNSKVEQSKAEILQAKMQQPTVAPPVNNTTVVNNSTSSSKGSSGGGSTSISSGDSSWVTMLVKGYGV